MDKQLADREQAAAVGNPMQSWTGVPCSRYILDLPVCKLSWDKCTDGSAGRSALTAHMRTDTHYHLL